MIREVLVVAAVILVVFLIVRFSRHGEGHDGKSPRYGARLRSNIKKMQENAPFKKRGE